MARTSCERMIHLSRRHWVSRQLQAVEVVRRRRHQAEVEEVEEPFLPQRLGVGEAVEALVSRAGGGELTHASYSYPSCPCSFPKEDGVIRRLLHLAVEVA